MVVYCFSLLYIWTYLTSVWLMQFWLKCRFESNSQFLVFLIYALILANYLNWTPNTPTLLNPAFKYLHDHLDISPSVAVFCSVSQVWDGPSQSPLILSSWWWWAPQWSRHLLCAKCELPTCQKRSCGAMNSHPSSLCLQLGNMLLIWPTLTRL